MSESSFYDVYDPFEYMARQAEVQELDEEDENKGEAEKPPETPPRMTAPSTPSGSHMKRVSVIVLLSDSLRVKDIHFASPSRLATQRDADSYQMGALDYAGHFTLSMVSISSSLEARDEHFSSLPSVAR